MFKTVSLFTLLLYICDWQFTCSLLLWQDSQIKTLAGPGELTFYLGTCCMTIESDELCLKAMFKAKVKAVVKASSSQL